MKNFRDVAKKIMREEALAILSVIEKLNDELEMAIDMLYRCKGRVVLTGIGKSGIICRKIASTLSSVGTPAMFIHPADSLHGDLGMLQRGDLLIVLSKSGETEEIIKILPWIKRLGIETIAITGNKDSTIARMSDLVLEIDVKEACPYNVIPTASTTVALALGDALSIALMERKHFRIEDFASLHPGGALGRRLFLKVEDLMHTGEEFPMVYEDTLMKHVILEITSKRLGVTAVFNGKEELTGVITDGDLRRALEKYDDAMLSKNARDVMTRNPKCILKDALAAHALTKMEEHAITSLFVLEKEGDKRPVGIIHIHDLLKAKVA